MPESGADTDAVDDGMDSDTADDPDSVTNTTRVVEVSAGGLHTCARLESGEVRCWGRNADGALGNGELSNQEESPVAVSGITNAVALESGHLNQCAQTGDDKVYCWGANSSNQIDTSDDSKISVPTAMGVGNVADIAVTSRAVCILLAGEGGLACIGDSANDPVVTGLPNFDKPVLSIAAGYHHACAILEGGKVECWGKDTEDEVGGPGAVDDLPSITALALGQFHSCALSDSGTVYCWGSNEAGQLGVGSDQRPDGAVHVEALSRIVQISSGLSHTCARDDEGAVTCWGDDSADFRNPLPSGIFGLDSGVEQLSAGSFHTCALRASGELRCWGRNAEGQLGDGTTESTAKPSEVQF